jgi:Leucine-rich repeat (LRR) protein
MEDQQEGFVENKEESESSLTPAMVSKGLKTLGIHPLAQKHTLLELSLPRLQLTDIELLKNYPLVMYLDISDNQVESLKPLENMTSLIHLRAR